MFCYVVTTDHFCSLPSRGSTIETSFDGPEATWVGCMHELLMHYLSVSSEQAQKTPSDRLSDIMVRYQAVCLRLQSVFQVKTSSAPAQGPQEPQPSLAIPRASLTERQTDGITVPKQFSSKV